MGSWVPDLENSSDGCIKLGTSFCGGHSPEPEYETWVAQRDAYRRRLVAGRSGAGGPLYRTGRVPKPAGSGCDRRHRSGRIAPANSPAAESFPFVNGVYEKPALAQCARRCFRGRSRNRRPTAW